MNDDSLSDPQLRSLEEQLAAHAPAVSSREKDQILYACAFEAGKNSASKSLGYWKSAVAGLSALLMVAVIPHLFVASGIGHQAMQKVAPSKSSLPPQSLPTESASALRKPLMAYLEAWKGQDSGGDSLGEQLAEFSQFDPHLRSLTVNSLTRNLPTP